MVLGRMVSGGVKGGGGGRGEGRGGGEESFSTSTP